MIRFRLPRMARRAPDDGLPAALRWDAPATSAALGGAPGRGRLLRETGQCLLLASPLRANRADYATPYAANAFGAFTIR